MHMLRETIIVLALAGVFLLILGIGELIHRILPARPESSRKSVHFLSGLTALSFPYLLNSHWFVLFLAGGFSLIVIMAKPKGFLKSLHNIERKSYGAIYFPLAIYILFLLSHNEPVLYFVAIIVMTVSDSLAALLGERYGCITYDVEGTSKSLEGSVVFFFVTFLCVHLSLLFITPLDKLNTVLIALVIATLVTGFEAISVNGTDNLVVPLGTYYVLGKMINQPLSLIFENLWMLLVMIGVTVPLMKKTRLLKPSAFIGMVLVNYAAWAICDLFWLLPLLLAQVMVVLVVRYLGDKVAEEITAHQITVLLYTVLVPTILIFASNTFRDWDIFYVPYVTSIIAQVAIISYFFLSSMVDAIGMTIKRTVKNKITMGMLCGLTSALVIGLAPIILSVVRSKFIGLLMTVLGAWLSIGIFEFLSTRYPLKEQRILRQKMRLLSVTLGTLAVFVTQHIAL